MSQFIVFDRGDEKFILFTHDILSITKPANGKVCVFFKALYHENGTNLEIDNTFEDIINQLKGQ
jgi:hypothetical protein